MAGPKLSPQDLLCTECEPSHSGNFELFQQRHTNIFCPGATSMVLTTFAEARSTFVLNLALAAAAARAASGVGVVDNALTLKTDIRLVICFRSIARDRGRKQWLQVCSGDRIFSKSRDFYLAKFLFISTHFQLHSTTIEPTPMLYSLHGIDVGGAHGVVGHLEGGLGVQRVLVLVFDVVNHLARDVLLARRL